MVNFDIEKAILGFPMLLFVILKIIEMIRDFIVTKKYIIEYSYFNIKKVSEVADFSINLSPKYNLVTFRDNGNIVIKLEDLMCIKNIDGAILYTKEQLEKRTNEY